MAKQKPTKPSNQAPVTSHPLFPAVVALWFGALFGLGSLAVRASLIEAAVLAIHLDVVIPSAAPPLGMTARIILALVMAAIGIAAGAVIARRLSRPKPVKRERRRDAAAIFGERQARTRQTGGYASAGTALISDSDTGNGNASPRRRALALEEQERQDYQFDVAPVPGSAPQILDVTQFDLSAPGDALADAERPFELQDLAPSAADAPTADVYHVDTPAYVAAAAQANVHGENVYGDCASPAAFAPPMSDAAQAIVDSPTALIGSISDLASDVASDLASDVASEFDRRPPPADFSRPFDLPAAAPVEVAAGEVFAPAFDQPAPAASSHVPDAPPPMEMFAAPGESAAARIASADLAELSPVELTERLALALQQRRHRGPAPAVLAEAVAALAGCETSPMPEMPEMPEIAAPPAPQPESSAAPAELGEDDFMDVTVSALPAFAAPSDLPEAPEALEAPAAASGLRLALPEALRPIDFSEYEDGDAADDVALPARSMGSPPPVGFAPVTQAAAADDVLTLGEDQIAEASDSPLPELAETDDEVKEDAYSSLLDLARPSPMRQTFVRVEEPEADRAEIEPVVIFPGHEARAGTRFAKPAPAVAAEPSPLETAPIAADGAPKLRRFDAPAAVAPAAALAAPAAPAQDPEETERALRSALATLQRMSGAA